jgi:hypothetical protein
VVTTGGLILISRSAFLFPNDADSCSSNKPSAYAVWVILIDNRKEARINKIMLKGKSLANRRLKDVDSVVNPAANVYKVNA